MKEIQTIRVRKKSTNRTIETNVDELLELKHYPEVGSDDTIYQVRDLQKAIQSLRNNKDLEIEIDFME